MSLPVVMLLVAASAAQDCESRDGLLTDAPAVPAAGTLRFSASSGAAPAADGTQAEARVAGSVLWSVGSGVAAGVGSTNEGGKLSPNVTLRWQFLSQETAAVDASGFLRFKSVGFRATGSEVEAAVSAGRSFGRLLLVVNGVVGKGFAGENAVDVEARTMISYGLSDAFRAGAEARLRSEVALGTETPAPGREYDAIAGPVLSWRVDYLTVEAIAGWGAPRGIAPAGPMAMALVAFDL